MVAVNNKILSKDLISLRAKKEAIYATIPALVTADGVMVSNFKATKMDAQYQDSNIVTGFSGNSKKSIKSIVAKVSFDVELGGPGVVGTKPAVGDFLECSGFVRVDDAAKTEYFYLEALDTVDSIAFELQDNGDNHLFAGCRGNCVIKATEDERLIASFSFTGLYSTPTSAAFTRFDFSRFNRSLIVNPDNVQSVTLLGNDVTAHSLEFDCGLKVDRIPAMNQKLVAATGNEPSAKIQIRKPEVSALNVYQLAEDESEGAAYFKLGSEAGKIVELKIHSQVLAPSDTDDTPKKMDIPLHPLPDGVTSGTVLTFS